MFADYLKEHALENILFGWQGMYPAATDRAAWQAVDAAQRQELMDLAAAYRDQPYPMRRATDFLAFVRSGSRKADENPYFFRRRKLCAAALGYCAQPDARDLDQVIDGLWCICEETSWVISAHNVNPIPGAPSPKEYPLPDGDDPYIDLFAGQTAMILTLVFDMMNDALDDTSDAIRRRVEGEIHRRVLTPFMRRDDFWWMGFVRKDLCNWTPWIVSNVMLTAAYWMQDQRQLAALLTRACRMLDSYLACVPQDGGCDEGAGYWNMAGGALLDCLDVLEQVTGGRMTFWQDEKIRNILSFPAKVQLRGGWFVNFADCDARPLLSGERLQFAGEKLADPQLAAMGARLRGTLAAQLDDTPQLWRLMNMLFHPQGQAQDDALPLDTWLPDLQVRVAEKDGLILCCKGGHNGESHNHNDVGSFMLYVEGEPAIIDAGNMVYTAKTFSDERYSLWNVRGAYHNIPIIGGCEQQPGKAFAAKNVQRLAHGLELDMAAAYGEEACVQACRRVMQLEDAHMLLQDEMILAEAKEVTWVFMLRYQPQLGASWLEAGSLHMAFNEELTAQVEEIPITDPRMARNYPGSLWRVTLTAKAACRHKRTFIMAKKA